MKPVLIRVNAYETNVYENQLLNQIETIYIPRILNSVAPHLNGLYIAEILQAIKGLPGYHITITTKNDDKYYIQVITSSLTKEIDLESYIATHNWLSGLIAIIPKHGISVLDVINKDIIEHNIIF